MKGRLEKMRANPKADWTIADVQALCREFGVHCEAHRSGGSHYEVFRPGRRDILVVPSRRPVKPYYIRQLVHFIDLVRDSDGHHTT